MTRHRALPPQLWLRLIGLLLAYVVAARLGLQYAVVGSTVTLVWAPSGIALAALLAWGPRLAPGVLAGAFIANASTGLAPEAALLIALGNMLEALLGAALLRRLAHQPLAFDELRDVFALIGPAGALGSIASATPGVLALAWVGTVEWSDFATVWLKWWLGDMMGMLVFAPLLLLLRQRWQRRAWPAPRRLAEALCLFAALGLLSLQIFGAPELAAHGYYASSLAVFPFVIWAALRFGPLGASLVTLTLALLAIWGTARGSGPFAVESPADGLLRWCAFGIVTAVTGLLLAAAVAERRRAQQALRDSHAELERRVDERTRALAGASLALRKEAAEAQRLEAALLHLGEEQQQSLGRELHDGLGQLLTSLSLMCASLQQRLAGQALPEAEALQRIGELIQQATALTRSVARGLYPVALEFGGLPAALEQLAEHTRQHLGRDCVVRLDPDLQQLRHPQAALHLYRVAQEAVSNAVKYSGAARLRIELNRSGGRVRLLIADDGVGADPARLRPGGSGGQGLASMRFRVGLLGGSLEIHSEPGRGTAVTASYPETESFQHEHEHEQPQRSA